METYSRGDELFASHGDRISSLPMGEQLDIAKGEEREKTRELKSPSGLLATNLGSCDGTETRVMLQGEVTCLVTWMSLDHVQNITHRLPLPAGWHCLHRLF